VSERKIRVLHVITRLIRGGADENTVSTVEGMDPERWEADLLAGHGSEVSGFSPLIREHTTILRDLVRDPNPVRDVIALVRMVRLIRRGRYDIVHTHTAKAGFLGRIAARIAGVPHVVHTLHGVTFHGHINPLMRRVYVLLERLAARHCDVMISVGEDVKRKYLAEAIGRHDQYVTIPSGMDTRPFEEARDHPETTRVPRRREHGFADHDLVVGMVSRLEPRKGYRYLLEAVARLAPVHPRLRVLIVGEGPQRSDLEGLAAALGIGDRVVFAGYRPDVAGTISSFDVAVLTSLWEGLPRVLVQYSLLEKPIVTFEVEGSREVVEDGVNGFVVPPKDVDVLVDRLDRVLANPTLRREFGRRSRERVEGRWDVELMVDRISSVYENVEAGRPLGELEPV
jgi:glycosyltransferase involved in cell wall biosynthesis